MFSETEHAAGPGISEILMAKPLTLTHPILTQEGRTSPCVVSIHAAACCVWIPSFRPIPDGARCLPGRAEAAADATDGGQSAGVGTVI
jgi:hypothetical protein